MLADIHGCTAPLVFGLAAALVILTSPAWQAAGSTRHAPRSTLHAPRSTLHAPRATPLLVALLLYVQIVLGAQLRHLAPRSGPSLFSLWLWLHLINSAVLAIAVVWLWSRTRSRKGSVRSMVGTAPGLPTLPRTCARRGSRRATLLAVLLAGQMALGVLAWLTRYGWPTWAATFLWPLDYTVVTAGRFQGLARSGHVAVGSLCLVTALSLAFWSRRLLGSGEPSCTRS